MYLSRGGDLNLLLKNSRNGLFSFILPNKFLKATYGKEIRKVIKEDANLELLFDFDNTPKRYVDVETGEHINLYAENIKDTYKIAVSDYFETIKLKCAQYRIKYVEADITKKFDNILTTYMIERQKFG